METKSNLIKKLCAIMAEIPAIPKTGKNSHFGYKYHEEYVIAETLRPLLAKHGVFIFHSIIDEQKEGDLTKIRVQYTFVDADSGENFEVFQIGYGKDNQDKGIYKASTGAQKFFFLRNFNLGSDQDPEKSESDTIKSRGPAKQSSPEAKATLPSTSARPPVPSGGASPLIDSDDPGEMLTDKGIKIKDVWMKHRVKAIQKANEIKNRLSTGDIPEVWEQSLLDYGVEHELITDA